MNSQIGRYQEENCISAVFFSEKNIKNLMKIIRQIVYNKTDKVIGEQSYAELQIIMNYYYTNAILNEELDIAPQIIQLNTDIINYSSNEIIENMGLLEKHVNCVFENPTNLQDRPTNESTKGSRTEFKNPFDF